MQIRFTKDSRVYHYTTSVALRSIVRDGVILPHQTRLYRDLAMNQIARDTEPLVWLSVNPDMEMTTYIKAIMQANRSEIVHGVFGSVCRIALPYPYEDDLGLAEYAELANIPVEDWKWNIRTGEMAGSNYTTWRIVRHAIPRSDWLGAEYLSGTTDAGFAWSSWPISQGGDRQ